MPTVTVKTNALQGTQVLIPDLGMYVPPSGGSLTFTDSDSFEAVLESRDILRLATDDAHNPNGSTLILNDGTVDIAEADLNTFLGHGNQAGGDLHADATGNVRGFMPLEDKHWANHGFDSAWTEGGALTYGAGLQVDVALGEVVANDASDNATGAGRVSWAATSVTLTANSINWIYVTSGGVVSVSTARPTSDLEVILGVAHANDTVPTMISQTRPARLQQQRSDSAEFVEKAFGGVATEGLIATENATPLHIDVSSGRFFLSGHRVDTSAVVDISWTYWYRDGSGGWTTVPSISLLDTGFYDDGSGALAALPANRWKKDLMHICENGSSIEFHLVYAQGTFPSEIQATTGFNPSPPVELVRHTARIAGGIVQSGGALATFSDERIRFGQNDPGSLSSLRTNTTWVPVLSSSSLTASSIGRQIVVPVASNGGANLQFAIPKETVTLVEASLIGLPSAGAGGAAKDIDVWTDYGQVGEAPTNHQESDLTSTYDLTGTTGLVTIVVDLLPILSSAEGGDIVGLEIKHNSIGGNIEYLGVFLVFTVLT